MAEQSTIDIVVTLKNGNVFQTLDNNAKKAFNSIDARLAKTTGMFRGLMGTLGLVGGAMGLGLLAKGVIKLGADLEQTRVSFEVLTGNAEIAAGLMTDLNDFANRTPYSNIDIIESAKMMMAYGVSTSDVMQNVKMLGDVSQGSAEKLSRMTLAFSQIQSTGRLMGQDLLQLVQGGFNPLKVISDKTGRSMLDLRKDMEAGKISAQMVSDAFLVATSSGGRFFGMMDKQSQTISGLWSTFAGNLQYVVAQLMDMNSGPLKELIVRMIDLSNKILQNQERIVNWVKAILITIKWIVIYKTAVAAATIGIRAWEIATTIHKIATIAMTQGLRAATAATTALNVSMKANMIGLVITGIIFLASKLIEMNRRIKEGTIEQQKFADQVQRTKDLANNVKELAVEYENLALLSTTKKVELFYNLKKSRDEQEAILDNAKLAYKVSEQGMAYEKNVARMRELNGKKNKTQSEFLEMQKLIGITTNQLKYGEDQFLAKMGNASRSQIYGTIKDLDQKIKTMEGMKIPGIDAVKFDLKPSEGVNDLTTELSTKRNIKNITLNIQQLTGIENFNTTNLTESTKKVEEMILTELNKAMFAFSSQN